MSKLFIVTCIKLGFFLRLACFAVIPAQPKWIQFLQAMQAMDGVFSPIFTSQTLQNQSLASSEAEEEAMDTFENGLLYISFCSVLKI